MGVTRGRDGAMRGGGASRWEVAALADGRWRRRQMGGGGVRIEEMGQPAGRTRGTKGDGRNERRRQMGGGGVRRGNTTTSRMRGLEGQDEWPDLSGNTADGSLMARYGA